MRNDLTPQVETCEIDDSDLDNVSGGLGIAVGVEAHLGAVNVSEMLRVDVHTGGHMHRGGMHHHGA